MKKITLFALLLVTLSSFAQQKINYKALIRDNSGNTISNQAITIEFDILANGNTSVYKEQHTPTTDDNGLIILNIGDGTILSGDFNTIDWAATPHFLNTKIDTGNGLTDMGTTEFMAVPYAKHATTATTALNAGAKRINELTDGKTTFSSLYLGTNSGDLDTNSNSNNVGVGFSALANNTTGDTNTAIGADALFSNTTGSENTATGRRALHHNTTGVSNTATGKSALYHNTTGNSNTATGKNALYHNTTGGTNTATGFNTLSSNTTGNSNTAIGAAALRSNTTGVANTATGFLALENNTTGNSNTAIGNAALSGNTTGSNNTAIGKNALNENTLGDENTATGVRALENNTTGDTNTATGSLALSDNTTGSENTANGANALSFNTTGNNNTAIGTSALFNNTTGDNNTANGKYALYSNTIGYNNTANGSEALHFNTTGHHNTANGPGALYANTTGNRNTANGSGALLFNTTGSENIAYGSGTLSNNITGSGNVAIGYQAGFNERGSNKLYIENSYTSNPLIYGEFDTNKLEVNGTLKVKEGTDASLSNGSGYFMIGVENGLNLLMDNNEIMARNNGSTSNLHLQVNGGNVYVGGSIVHSSDRRLKKNITALKYGLNEILALEPKSYDWKNRKQKYKSLGLIAQDVQPIIKEIVLVQKKKKKTLAIDYTSLIPILINAIKEQQVQINNLKKTSKAQETALLKYAERLENNSKITAESLNN